MRALLVPLAVLGSVSVAAPRVMAAPPADITAYCRATQPSTQGQVRCLFTERGAQDRATRARASAAPDAWARCENVSGSWTDMASCLGQTGAPGGVTTSVGGAAAPSPTERDEAKPEQGGDAAHGATAATPEPSEPAAPASTIDPSPSTVILGPRGTAASAASEPNRVTRPVTEAEAERHLKGVLERSGEPAARCTKTQYSGGWVTVCD
jgi:hypothetical protein